MERIILDCDNTMGVQGCDVDDGLALLYLLGRADIEICGITTTYGNSDIETVYSCTIKMLQEIGRSDIPLLKGCPNKKTLHSEASEFIVKTIDESTDDISILAIGSLTNLYSAYLIDHTVFSKIKQIVIMGGITSELIINGKTLDELNLSCDAVAAECVFKKGKDVSVVTGNNCLEAFFTQEDFEQRLVTSRKPVARYITEKCSYWFADMMATFKIQGFHNWDVVAAAYLINPSLFKDNLQYINTDNKKLEQGYLSITDEHSESSLINIPAIADLNAFTDDVYNTWLEVQFYNTED